MGSSITSYLMVSSPKGIVRDKHLCVTLSLTLREEFYEALQKIFPIPVVDEYLSAFDTPDHDMAQDTWRIQMACLGIMS